MHRENLAARSIVQIHCGSHQMAFGCGSAALCNLWMLIQKLKRVPISSRLGPCAEVACPKYGEV